MYQWIIYGLILWVGILIGVMLKAWLNYKFKHYSGALVVIEEEDKTVYSLELYESVEMLEISSDVTFKVIPPEKKSDRD